MVVVITHSAVVCWACPFISTRRDCRLSGEEEAGAMKCWLSPESGNSGGQNSVPLSCLAFPCSAQPHNCHAPPSPPAPTSCGKQQVFYYRPIWRTRRRYLSAKCLSSIRPYQYRELGGGIFLPSVAPPYQYSELVQRSLSVKWLQYFVPL